MYYGNTIFVVSIYFHTTVIINDFIFRSAYECCVKHYDSCILLHQMRKNIIVTKVTL